MLSYKHAFHAGNFADVLKHLCWLDIIDYLGKKAKPFSLYDTHSGAGRYALDSDSALKTREFENGIDALVGGTFDDPLVTRYLQLCVHYREAGHYPGSPVIALEALTRSEDVHLMELHPNEHQLLKANTRPWPHAHVHHRDGFEGLLALTPPANRRGAVLIDPPYERKEEYGQVVDTVKQLLHRWQQAHVIVWYPKLSARAGEKSGAAEKMVARLAALADAAFTAELCITDNQQDAGMYGSGVLVMNPPWQCDTRLSDAVDTIMPVLPESASYACHWHKRAQ